MFNHKEEQMKLYHRHYYEEPLYFINFWEKLIVFGTYENSLLKLYQQLSAFGSGNAFWKFYAEQVFLLSYENAHENSIWSSINLYFFERWECCSQKSIDKSFFPIWKLLFFISKALYLDIYQQRCLARQKHFHETISQRFFFYLWKFVRESL